MKEADTTAIALAQLELLADHAVQSLGALQAQIAVLRQALNVNPNILTVPEKQTPPPSPHAKDRSKWYLQGAQQLGQPAQCPFFCRLS